MWHDITSVLSLGLKRAQYGGFVLDKLISIGKLSMSCASTT